MYELQRKAYNPRRTEVRSTSPKRTSKTSDLVTQPALAEAILLDIAAGILGEQPYDDRAVFNAVHSNLTSSYDFAVAVPVRDEEALLPRTLDALHTALSQSYHRGALIFVVNNTSDHSTQLIAEFAAKRECATGIVDVDFEQSICNASHARRLALDIAARLAPDGYLLTTDADSHVRPAWARTMMAHLECGFELVCEDVRLDEQELAALPARVRQVGDAERAYFEACTLLWQRWTRDLTSYFAYRASGASLGVTSFAYREIGGLPAPKVGEDKALCAEMLERGHALCQLRDVGTRTSARLENRAVGGCGEALSHRALAANPECDGALVPLDVLRQRAERYVAGRSLECGASARPMRYEMVLLELARARHFLNGRRGRDAA